MFIRFNHRVLVFGHLVLALSVLSEEHQFLYAAQPKTIALSAVAGFSIKPAASAPLVERPMFGALDASGALFVLDSGGVNDKSRGEKPPDVIRRLSDTDGDGIYDKSAIFADGIAFGTGMVWYDNALFVTSPPSLWKFEDTTGDGVADKRTELVTGFAFNQSCTDDLHGACLGPDGRIYFLPGRFAHKVRVPGGPILRDGMGPWLMRCRPDGRDVEFVSGAVGNPVEVAFLPSGDAFVQGTFWAKPSAEGGLRDALIHAIAGGEYSVRDRDYTDRIRTGDYLPALVPLTATAPSGLTSYNGGGWGNEYRHNLFTSHFNTGKILRHKLTPDGGTFVAVTEDFVTGSDGNIHFTDVLQDADGSLLVIDTGGWFRACCPASGSSQPNVMGSIYRVTQDRAPVVIDPYGKKLTWDKASIAKLTQRLDDPRFAVSERAVYQLSKAGDQGLQGLALVLRTSESSSLRRLNAVWALCRMDEEAARDVGRIALRDPSADVRQAAASVAALHRDTAALDTLIELLRDPSAMVRREAAHALGRIGRAQAVPSLFSSIAAEPKPTDTAAVRFVEHAMIFALIEINDPKSTRRGLESVNAGVRRAALIALDQMPDGKLQPGEVTPLLVSTDVPLRQTAIGVLTRHHQWSSESVQLIDGWLGERELDDLRVGTIAKLVRTLQGDPDLQQLIQRRLAKNSKLAPDAQRALLTALASSGVQKVPPAWRAGIGAAINADDEGVRLAAIKAVESLQLKELGDEMHRPASDSAASAAIRLAALRSLSSLQQELSIKDFDYLLSRLAPEIPIQERMVALDVVARSKHDAARLNRMLPLVREASPIELPHLLAAFAGGASSDVGLALVEALSASTVNPPPELVAHTLKPYDTEVQAAARPLLTRLTQSIKEQVERLDKMEQALAKDKGDVGRGRELFFVKAQCHLCHSVAGQGGKVGPDLTTIGDIRSRRDLLEAIVFPSTTFARGYEPIIVLLRDGRTVTGLAGRETTNELILMSLQDNKPVEVPLRRDTIEQVQLGRVSVMPQGLDSQLQPQELSDLISYLQQLRKAKSDSRGGE